MTYEFVLFSVLTETLLYSCGGWFELEHGSKAALLFGTCTSKKMSYLSSRWGHGIYRQCYWCYPSENNQDRIQGLHCDHCRTPYTHCYGLQYGTCNEWRYVFFMNLL